MISMISCLADSGQSFLKGSAGSNATPIATIIRSSSHINEMLKLNLGSMPNQIAVLTVIAIRDIPGSKARVWAQPITKALKILSSVLVLLGA